MGFIVIGNLSGNWNRIIRNQYITAALAVKKGSLVKKVAGSQSVALAATGTLTTVCVYGVNQKLSGTGTTHTTTPIELVGPGTILAAQIEEIALKTTLTATGGSTTTTVDDSLVGPGSDDVLIGSEIEVVTNAAGLAVGTKLTLTDYTVSTGTMTYSTTTTTAASDTYKINNVGWTIGNRYLIGEDLLDVNGEADMIEFNIAAGGDWCRVIDVVNGGKLLHVAVTASSGNATVVTV